MIFIAIPPKSLSLLRVEQKFQVLLKDCSKLEGFDVSDIARSAILLSRQLYIFSWDKSIKRVM